FRRFALVGICRHASNNCAKLKDVLRYICPGPVTNLILCGNTSAVTMFVPLIGGLRLGRMSSLCAHIVLNGIVGSWLCWIHLVLLPFGLATRPALMQVLRPRYLCRRSQMLVATVSIF